jgi:predicted P-loop ATPase/GTPase
MLSTNAASLGMCLLCVGTLEQDDNATTAAAPIVNKTLEMFFFIKEKNVKGF